MHFNLLRTGTRKNSPYIQIAQGHKTSSHGRLFCLVIRSVLLLKPRLLDVGSGASRGHRAQTAGAALHVLLVEPVSKEEKPRF